jgi:hypothetical protein
VKRKVLASLALWMLSLGCNHRPRISDNVAKTTARSRQLSILAAREAGNIRDTDARLTRQLNIASQVLHRFSKSDATIVLRDVVTTLAEKGRELNSHARLSGWVSVSQLSREADDKKLAIDAIVQAGKELEAIENPAERCQYVMGVAEEISQLQGEAEAAELLVKGGKWVSSIEDTAERRMARRAFAVALFNLDDYDGAVATLRHEQDPVWSSDTMLQLAAPDASEPSPRAYAARRESKRSPGAAMAMEREDSAQAPMAMPVAAGVGDGRYGKRLGFSEVFQGKQVSATAAPAAAASE